MIEILFPISEEGRRKYGDMVVGLTHSRGVVGVMPGESRGFGALEGVSRKTPSMGQKRKILIVGLTVLLQVIQSWYIRYLSLIF